MSGAVQYLSTGAVEGQMDGSVRPQGSGSLSTIRTKWNWSVTRPLTTKSN